MGCKSSKQSVCRNCQTPCSPVRRSFSSYAHRSPQVRDADDRHVVALTSTTLGYLYLDSSQTRQPPVRRNVPEKNSKDFAVGVIEAKTWSKMIDEKLTKIVPKTPIGTPPGEPETINAWELMEGLDDSIDDTKKTSETKFEKHKLILYFTSLRAVRKTYEDCCHVRSILKGTGIRVDERDVSMHSGFKEELKVLLGDRNNNGELPKVFVGKKYIGGADEIRRLHEDCELDNVLEGCEMVDFDGCEACGDVRFLPCGTCFGSCKIYLETDTNRSEKEEDEEEEESDYGFQRCRDCNENGLVRCPICCD